MKADLSRSTFSPFKHFHDVRLQQGRVQLDADWNEQIDIAAHRVETETIDVVGPCGAPVDDAAFALAVQASALPNDQQAAANALGAPVTGDFFLSAGRFYAQGILCENESPIKLSLQPDLPNSKPISASGLYLAYLDVWPRLLTFLDDPSIREVALNGPDTADRVKTIWQVKVVKVGETGSTPDCSADYSAFDNATAAPTGKLSAQAEPDSTDDKPCIIAPGAGYRSLENQLYRVEVHQGGPDGTATFKWSRDNGAVAARWQPTSTNNIIQLLHPPADEKLGFAVGQWVEISDDNNDLNAQPGMLVQITHVDPQFLTLGTPPQPLTNFTLNPKVRRWDSANANDTAGDIVITAGSWISLENGVQVQFASGTFRTGDYWLIPARTATGNVEWPTDGSGNHIASPPHGIPHAYCRLGFVDFNGTNITPTDCRSLFPPLTAAHPGCDLKLHNQHLHGWGVVCGLQVHCAGDRNLVTINSGHAILCDGTDVLLRSPRDFSVVTQAQTLKLLDSTNSGSVVIELTADNSSQPVFSVAPPPVDTATTFLQQILEGTIWSDFYQQCLQPLITYYKTDFGVNPNDTKLVPDNKRRLTAAINLLYQFSNTAPGGRVWLSAAEHNLLQTAYKDLLDVLGSQTFCAIKDNLVAFPTYPFATLNITTMFGKTPLVGARISPDGGTIIAFDNGTTGNFYLFNATNGEMTDALSVTSASPLTVRDVLVFGSATAPQLLVAATGNGNTSLAVFDLTSKQLVGTPQNVFGLEISRLEQSPFDNTNALAIGVGHGLYLFNPASLGANSLTQPLVTFNAAGHLAVSGNFIAATVANEGSTTPYTSLMLGPLDQTGGGLQPVALKGMDGSVAQGNDGLAIIPAPGVEIVGPTVYVGVSAATNSTSKRALAINTNGNSTNAELTLPTSGQVAFTSNGQQLLVALADECQVLWIDPTKNVVDTTQALPTQIAPVAFATVTGAVPRNFGLERILLTRRVADVAPGTAPPGPPLIAINRISQTLTVIPANLVGVTPDPVDFTALTAYRNSMINAFKDLLLRLVQDLKDCLCYRLLLDCPTCAEGDVVYLATIDIKSGQVYHICNFIRREVLTFPKVKYWLSAVPVIPIIHWAVEKFCCSVLPEFSSKITPSTFTTVPTTNAIFERIQTSNFQVNLPTTLARYNVLGKYAVQAAVTRAMLPSTVAMAPSKVLQASAETATAVLAKQGVAVANVADYHTALASNLPLIDASAVPLNFQPGDKVNLYTQNGRVVYYTRVAMPVSTPAPAAVGTTVAPTAATAAPTGTGAAPTAVTAPPATAPVDVQGLQTELGNLRTQITSLQQAHADALKQIGELQATTAALQAGRGT